MNEPDKLTDGLEEILDLHRNCNPDECEAKFLINVISDLYGHTWHLADLVDGMVRSELADAYVKKLSSEAWNYLDRMPDGIGG